MQYISTRDEKVLVNSSQAILSGISEEGGLFVPVNFPSLGELEDLLELDYRELTFYILNKYLTDLDENELKEAVNNAYDEKFETEETIRLKKIKEMNFLELYHGPTLAFKDMALSLLPYLLKLASEKEKVTEEIVILTATSGDTGKAALEGFADIPGVKIIVFYPEDGVSEVQKLQMITQEGDNTLVVGIKGNFDDAQNGVKEIFNNKGFARKLKNNNYLLSSANSINIGRLLPQVSYYIYSYIQLAKNEQIELGEEINIVVPTGNFGNILAAYYAKSMGLPVNKLISANNENKVVGDFLNTGKYIVGENLILSSSPSMDILISSNLERLLFHLSDSNHQEVSKKMEDLVQKGEYDFSELDRTSFYGDYANEIEVENAIHELFGEENYLIDPHTAVAYGVYKKYKDKFKDERATLIASTASPFKFGVKVAESVDLAVEELDEFQILANLAEKTNIEIPKAIENLQTKEVKHQNTIEKEKMFNIIEDFLKIGGKNDKS